MTSDSVTKRLSKEPMYWHMSVFTLVKNLLVSDITLFRTIDFVPVLLGEVRSWYWDRVRYGCVHCTLRYSPIRTSLHDFIMGFFSLSILWKTFPPSFNNERTRKEFLPSSSRLRRKSKIERRWTRGIKFRRTFTSFSLATTKFNTRSCKYFYNNYYGPFSGWEFSIMNFG